MVLSKEQQSYSVPTDRTDSITKRQSPVFDEDSQIPSSTEERITKFQGYIRVLIVCISVSFCYSGYYAIFSLLTSFDQELGHLVGILLWIPYIPSQLFLSPTIVKILNPKYSLVAAFSCYTFFYATNIYPTWYTLPLGAVVYALGAGVFFWSGALSYFTHIAFAISKTTGASARDYVSKFHGLFFLSLAVSSVIGTALASAFLLSDQLSLMLDSVSVVNRSSSNASNSTPAQCNRDVQLATVSPWAYYGLTIVFTGLGVLAVILILFLPPRPKKCCQKCKLSLPHVNRSCICQMTKTVVVRPLNLLFSKSFLAVGGVAIFAGYQLSYFNGIFTKHFVSECLGVGIVGPVVMVWGISCAVASYVTGHISVYVTRTALAAVLGGLQSAFAFFQLFWERQPSYYMVFTGAVIQGIIHGTVLPLSTMYLGIVSEAKDREIVFSIARGLSGIGGAIVFIISSFTSVEVNLITMLCILVPSVVLYIAVERLTGTDPIKKPSCKEGPCKNSCSWTRSSKVVQTLSST